MAKLQNYLVNKVEGVFAHGALHPYGSIVQLDPETVDEGDTHVVQVDGSMVNPPAVEVSAVAPTGPNPTAPQQIAPDARQTVRGYEQPGARLVGEVTANETERLEAANLLDDGDTTQGDLTDQLAEAGVAAANADAKPAAAKADAKPAAGKVK